MFFLNIIDNGDEAQSLTFFIHVCMNYLNNFLIEDKAVSAEVLTKAKGILRADFRVEAKKMTWEVGIKVLLLLIGAFSQVPADVLLIKISGRRRFYLRLQ